MTKKEKLISFLAATHLLVVCLGAGQIEVIKWPIIGNALAYYGALTGASSGYGFFAPGVGSSFRAEFDVASKSNSFTTKLEQNNNRESDLRFGNILGMLSRNIEDEKARRAIAASWAGKMFARYPDAEAITVRLEIHGVPMMPFYKEGIRANWEPFYRAKFVKAQRGKAE